MQMTCPCGREVTLERRRAGFTATCACGVSHTDSNTTAELFWAEWRTKHRRSLGAPRKREEVWQLGARALKRMAKGDWQTLDEVAREFAATCTELRVSLAHKRNQPGLDREALRLLEHDLKGRPSSVAVRLSIPLARVRRIAGLDGWSIRGCAPF